MELPAGLLLDAGLLIGGAQLDALGQPVGRDLGLEDEGEEVAVVSALRSTTRLASSCSTSSSVVAGGPRG